MSNQELEVQGKVKSISVTTEVTPPYAGRIEVHGSSDTFVIKEADNIRLLLPLLIYSIDAGKEILIKGLKEADNSYRIIKINTVEG